MRSRSLEPPKLDDGPSSEPPRDSPSSSFSLLSSARGKDADRLYSGDHCYILPVGSRQLLLALAFAIGRDTEIYMFFLSLDIVDLESRQASPG
jgi:hypothetical protein